MRKKSLSFKVLVAETALRTEKDYTPAPRIFLGGDVNELDPEKTFEHVHQELVHIAAGKTVDHFRLIPQLNGRLYRPKYEFESKFPFSIQGFKKLRTSMSNLIQDIKTSTDNNDITGVHSMPPYLGVRVDLIINPRDKALTMARSLADSPVSPLVASDVQHHLTNLVDRFALEHKISGAVHAMNVTFFKQGLIQSDKVHTFTDIKSATTVAPEEHNVLLSALIACDPRLTEKIHSLIEEVNMEMQEHKATGNGMSLIQRRAEMKPELPTREKSPRLAEIEIYGFFSTLGQKITEVQKKVIVDIDDPDFSVKLRDEFYNSLTLGETYKASWVSVPTIGTLFNDTPRTLIEPFDHRCFVVSVAGSREMVTSDDVVDDDLKHFGLLASKLKERYGPVRHDYPVAFNLISTLSTAFQFGFLINSNGENQVKFLKKSYNLIDKNAVSKIVNDLIHGLLPDGIDGSTVTAGDLRKIAKFAIEIPRYGSVSFDHPSTLKFDHNGILKLEFDHVGLPNFSEHLSHHVENAVKKLNGDFASEKFSCHGVALGLSQEQIAKLESKQEVKLVEKPSEKETKPAAKARTKKLKVDDIVNPAIRGRVEAYKAELAKNLKARSEQDMLEAINCIAKKITINDPKAVSDALIAINEVVAQTGAMISTIDKVIKK
jgi:hypothetical protein